MRLILVRHFKTLINDWEQIMGWGDSPRAEGWEADLLFVDDVLREAGIGFDAIYSSYLERARQTAMFYARKRDIRLIRDAPELNEINYGDLYRKSKKWVSKHVPQHKKDPDFVYPGGESFHQMQQRSTEFVLGLEPKHRDHTLLVVAHAGVIRGMIAYFLGLDYASNLKRRVSHRYIGDFHVQDGNCVCYDELGTHSDFVRDGIVEVPSGSPQTGLVIGRAPGESAGAASA